MSSLKLFIALISPIVPQLIKSSASAAPLYFFTTWATRRRLCRIRISLASFAVVNSSAVASGLFPAWNFLMYSSSSLFGRGFGKEDFSWTKPEKKRTFDKKVRKFSKIIINLYAESCRNVRGALKVKCFDILIYSLYYFTVDSRQKKNLIIKIAIIVAVIALVSIYMFTMRASANSVGNKDDVPPSSSSYIVSFYIDGIKFDASENKGAETVVPVPKRERNYFVGWYLDVAFENIYVPSADNGNKSLVVHAKFKTMESAITEFIQVQSGRMFVMDNFIFRYSMFDSSVTVENSDPFEYLVEPEESLPCIIAYNLMSEDGDAFLGKFGSFTAVRYMVNMDYSLLDYNEVGKFGISETSSMDFETVTIGDALPIDVQDAVGYYIGDVALAVEKLIHHIAKLPGNNYRF